MDKKIELNIVPKTSIYATFDRLSYKPEYALAEFIDNSTASFYSNEDELKRFYAMKKKRYVLGVYIIYDRENKNIMIHDNAMGMEIDDFKRAIILDSKPTDRSGRNEFGMGLKTAATWFSEKWSIESTALGSKSTYKCVMDIEKIKADSQENVDITESVAEENRHYTTIRLEKLKKTFNVKQMKTLVGMLTGMYRNDLRKNNIKIFFIEKKGNKYIDYFSDEKVLSNFSEAKSLKFEEVEPRMILTSEYPEIKEDTLAKTEFSDSIEFEGVNYRVYGFYGIRKVGSRPNAGFAVLRRGRVILGAYKNAYRPIEVFGDMGSFPYQRLYGEIHVDDFPVNQAKDGFAWDNGLQDAFINFLSEKTAFYKDVANKIRKNEDSGINQVKENDFQKVNSKTADGVSSIISNLNSNNNDEIKMEIVEHNEASRGIVNKELLHTTEFVFSNSRDKNKLTRYLIGFSKVKNPSEWISMHEVELTGYKINYEIVINIEHKTLKPLSENSDFIAFMKLFGSGYAISMLSLKDNAHDGMISPFELNELYNNFVEKGEF